MAPWLTILLIAVLFVFLQGSLSPVPSLLFDLPEAGAADSAQPGLVALLIPGDMEGSESDGTLVYFDDARYVMSDRASLDEFSSRLGERAIETKCGVLTLLSDRRVPAGDIMKIMSLAKAARLLHVQLAEKRD
jgi:biopolymer transport protein ExbD